MLDVVPSCYSAWRYRQAAGAVGTREPTWETKMLAVFDHHKCHYGTRRLPVELRGNGHRMVRQALRTDPRWHGRRTYSPRRLPRARPIQRTGSGASRTCHPTSPARARLTGYG